MVYELCISPSGSYPARSPVVTGQKNINTISFGISSTVSVNSIIEFCCQEMNKSESEFIKVDDFFEHAIENKIDSTQCYITYYVRSGQFDVWIEIYTGDEKYSNLNSVVEFLRTISEFLNEEIVTSDDTIDAFSFILIEPSGIASTIDVDYDAYNKKDEINFGRYENPFFGQFAMKVKLDELKIKNDLAGIFSTEFDSFVLQLSFSGPITNGPFNTQKLKFKELKNYRYFVDIIPKGKQRWFSIEDKSRIFIQRMAEYSQKEEIDLCLFPADFAMVENIEGGSDSENYCINCENGVIKKIVYKPRRKSWRNN